MARSPESKGFCSFCGTVVTRRGLAKHLEQCPDWQHQLQAAESGKQRVETLWHLRVRDAYLKIFWLELEMAGPAALYHLDNYLRAIWLECCNHLSAFETTGRDGMEIDMDLKADAVFQKGLKLRHLYDFGTTSLTDVSVIGSRSGKRIGKHPITLLARNALPETSCQVCGQPAGWLCIQCLYEGDETGCLCDEHVEGHPHDDYGEPVRIYNSPRTGMCGYNGPAEPPY